MPFRKSWIISHAKAALPSMRMQMRMVLSMPTGTGVAEDDPCAGFHTSCPRATMCACENAAFRRFFFSLYAGMCGVVGDGLRDLRQSLMTAFTHRQHIAPGHKGQHQQPALDVQPVYGKVGGRCADVKAQQRQGVKFQLPQVRPVTVTQVAGQGQGRLLRVVGGKIVEL